MPGAKPLEEVCESWPAFARLACQVPDTAAQIGGRVESAMHEHAVAETPRPEDEPVERTLSLWECLEDGLVCHALAGMAVAPGMVYGEQEVRAGFARLAARARIWGGHFALLGGEWLGPAIAPTAGGTCTERVS